MPDVTEVKDIGPAHAPDRGAAHRLMVAALRHPEHETHRAAPGLIRSRLTRIPDDRVADSAAMFVAAVRACVREELRAGGAR